MQKGYRFQNNKQIFLTDLFFPVLPLSFFTTKEKEKKINKKKRIFGAKEVSSTK